MKKLIIYFLLLLALPASLWAQVTVSGSSGANGNYASLTVAGDAFDKINLTDQTGNNIIITITSSSTAEDGATSLNAGNWTTLTIYPTGSSYIISGDVAGPLINLSGADNVTIDGRVNQSGGKDLTITNISTDYQASTIQFIESAQNNTVKYCNITGSSTNDVGGIIFFSTASTGTGNSSNTITYNDITSDGAGRPLNAIYSSGIVDLENSGNTISHNNIYDFLNSGQSSTGIFLSDNSTSWTISDNSFYESASFTPTSGSIFYAIKIDNSAGNNFTITGNYIGGRSASCGGSAWTKTSARNNIFYAMYLNVGTVTASSVQSNTIKNFAWSNQSSAAWTAIHIAGGDVNIGTGTANTIGTTNTTGSITVTSGGTGANVYGINIASGGTVDCENNTIGSITAATSSSTLASNFTGINKTATAGTTTISNNTIGSSTANSINASSGSTSNAQSVFGISNAGSGTITISANTITNLTNGTTNGTTGTTGLINGIKSTYGTNTISNNIIHDLKIANANSSSTNTAAICGIALTNTTLKTVSGNTIYNLSNTYVSFAGSVIGLYFTGSTGANVVRENFIHSLSITGGSSTTANIYGIQMAAGATTYSNNIIGLAGSTTTTIYGIYETGAASNNNNLYFNTVYIGGTPGSGSNKSYALYSAVTTNTRDFRNNVFANARKTTGGGGSSLHYAAYFNYGVSTNLTLDYNDYYADISLGGVLGRYNSLDVTSAPLIAGKDVYSFAILPVFATTPPATTATDYKIGEDLIGIAGAGIPTTDYGLNARNNPTMGAWERVINKWKGGTSTVWGLAANWTGTAVPLTNSSIIFDASPTRDLNLDANRTVTNITNGSTRNLVLNGWKLTVKGDLSFTGSGKITASATSSILEFAGSAVQSIPAGVFTSNRVYDLTINNANNVTLNGTLNLLHNITATSGLLDAITNSPTINYLGSSAQTIGSNVFYTDNIYSLSITNSSGVTLTSNAFTVGTLTNGSTSLFEIDPGKLLTVTGTFTNINDETGFIIKSDATGDGKLINNSAAVAATVELYLTGGTGGSGPIFHYFVPPVITMNIDNTDPASCAASLLLTNFNGDLMAYSESAAGSNKDMGWEYFDGYTTGGYTYAPFSSLSSSLGYNIRVTADDKVTFKGTSLNDSPSAHSYSLSNSSGGLGWNLVGNPFPCNYDLNGISALTATGDNVDNTVYYNHDGGYAYWNVETHAGTTGYSDIVAPMQGFFVHVPAVGTPSLSLPIGSKTASTAFPSRSKGADLIKKMKLVLNNGPVPDETIVCLIDKATTGFDGDYDAYKLFGGNSSTPFIYTQLNSVKYAINSIKDPGSSSAVIPVTIILKSSGTYKINITEFENLDGINVVLRHGADETILSKNASYTFTSAAGTFTDFQIVIGNTATGIEPLTNEKLKTWYSNNYMYINCPDGISSDKGSLIIYDLQGKAVYTNNLIYITPGETIQLPLNLPRGVYITRVIVNNQPFVSKIVVL